MKKMKYLFLIVMSMLLVSCDGPLVTKTIMEKSEDSRLQIEITGKRENVVEPFTVEIVAKKEGVQPLKATTEIYQSDLTSENVSFNWKSNNHCIVKLTHRDGKIETVPIKFVGVE